MMLDFESYNESLNEATGLQAEYQKYFKELLKEFEVSSPAKLSPEDKKKFFDKVKSGWVKGQGRKDKTNEENINEDKYTSMMEDERSLRNSLKALFEKKYVMELGQKTICKIVEKTMEELEIPKDAD